MLLVYGADWCEDTRRSLRHLRRLGVAHQYINIDEDAEALARAKDLNDGRRRTPTIEAGVGLALIVAAAGAPRALRWPLRAAGAGAALTGLTGWCPVYHAGGVTSLHGPGDHPHEAERAAWLAAR